MNDQAIAIADPPTDADVEATLKAAHANGEWLAQGFAYAHLPAHLQVVSAPFGRLAAWVITNTPRNPERTVALRKLLESKDCAVRSVVFK